jgi:tetratricopeptide (TPR) repeat protein
MSNLSFILLSEILLSAALASGFPWQSAQAQDGSKSPSDSPAAPSPARPLISAEQRGDIFVARKMYREAIESYREAPETAVLINKIGIAYHQLSDLQDAQKYYQRAVKLDPQYAEAINNIGTVYYSQQSYRRAINQYKKVLRLRPDSASTLANLGSAYFARKQYELASENYQKALALDPTVFESRGGAGQLVRDRSVGDRPMFFYYLAKSFAKAGMFDQALSYIRKSLEEGFKERQKFVNEPEFAGLQQDPEFQKLMSTEPKVL